MINVFRISPDRMDTFFRTLLDTDLIAYIFIILIIYTGVGAFVLSALEFYFPEDFQTESFTNIFNGLSFIIGFLYYKWIANALDNYMSGPKMYCELCAKIASFSDVYFSMHHNNVKTDHKELKDVRDCLIAMVFCFFFLPHTYIFLKIDYGIYL